MMGKRRILAGLFALALALLPAIGAIRAMPTQAQVVPVEGDRISPELRETLRLLEADEQVTVIVTLREQASLRALEHLERAERQWYIITALRNHAARSQAALLALLDAWRSQGSVERVIPFWIFNGFALTANKAVIQWLAERSEVLRITPNVIYTVPTPPSETESANPTSVDIEPNLAVVQVPKLWAMGYRGQGIVVANMDTGVDITHPALGARWRGGNNSWFDPHGQHPDLPTDVQGHGTWTMGLMVGGDVGGSAIGVAPEAQWIAVKIFDDNGYADSVSIHQGFQWLLDPDGDPQTPDAPHVLNNSWAFNQTGCDLAFREDLRALWAAGILPIFAAGNSGPEPETSCSPANYPEALAVGATDNGDVIYTYSGRGPALCEDSVTLFPDIVAPGQNVRTTDLGGGYRYVTGTSMAAPHVAGAVALLLCAYPGLSVERQRDALINTGLDLGAQGADNDYGHGRLDIWSAYCWLARSGTSARAYVYLPMLDVGAR